MSLHFDNESTSQLDDPLQPTRGRERHQRKEEVSQAVAPGEHAVHQSSIDDVPEALLTDLKRKASPHHRASGQEAREQHIRAEVHVMMAVEPVRGRPVQAPELVELGGDDVVERPREPRMKYGLAEPVTPQVPGHLLLALNQSPRTSRGRERARQVEVQAHLDSLLLSDRGGAP